MRGSQAPSRHGLATASRTVPLKEVTPVQTTTHPKIQAIGVQKVFTDGETGRQVVAIDRVDLDIKEGELLVIIGASGCGKSTFLYMTAGFEHPSSGQLLLNNQPIKRPGPDRGIVFQDFVLYPWRTVLRNISMGLELNGIKRPEAREKAMEYIRLIGLEGFEHAYPHTLSGGMKQRVALARALVYDPEVLLMDEPFGALDAQTKSFMIGDLERIWQTSGKTIVFVTHSISEAIRLGDRVVVLSARPSQIKEIVPINLPRPRDVTSPEFTALEKRLMALLSGEVRKSMEEERAHS